jgi:hypothetical protein
MKKILIATDGSPASRPLSSLPARNASSAEIVVNRQLRSGCARMQGATRSAG